MLQTVTFQKFLIHTWAISYSKYSIGYLYNDHRVKPLHVMLPKISAYVKSYDGITKCMYF